MTDAPDPMTLHPVEGAKRVVFLKPLVTHPNVSAPSRGDTVVGHDVWLGYRALILPGVTIGHGAVVAAASVVASDVPPYAVVAGNPARVVRRRYGDDDVERLLRAAWWDWPIELVTEHARTIMSGTPAELERIAAGR